MRTIYVSPNGSDFGDGSSEHPYKTIEQARDFIRKIKKTDPQEKFEVKIGKGVYYVQHPIRFTPEDSGKPDSPIRYFADDAVFMGARPLPKPAWRPWEQNSSVMVTALEAGLHVDGLLMNGQPQICARFPNYKKDVLPLGSAATEALIKERVSGYANPQGGYIRALHEYRWGGNSYLIIGKNPEKPLGLDLLWAGDNNRGSGYDPEALVVENVLEELDQPGEWYYERKTGFLYFYPPSCEYQTAEYALVTTPELFSFKGTKENPVHDIILSGFALEHTARTLSVLGQDGWNYEPLLRGDWAVVRKGVITLEGTKGIRISHCRFLRSGGNGIFFSGYQDACTVSNCVFADCGASCIQLAGLPEAVWEPSFWPYENDMDHQIHKTFVEFPDQSGPKTEDYPRNILIEQNHMYNMGIWEKQASGVNLSVCQNIRILHNTIHQSARSCINVNDGCFGGHEIAWNDIFDSQRETDDHGPFNAWGRDRFWSVPKYNAMGLYGEDARPYALLDVVKPIEIHHNRFHHAPDKSHTWGIDLDDGSSNYRIHDNLCLGLGIKLREGFDRQVTNNIIVGGQLNIHCTYAQARDKISGNLIIHSEPWAFAGMEGDGHERIKKGELWVDYNWYVSPSGNLTLPAFWQELGFDRYCLLNEEPQFAAPEKNDYTPLTTAIEKIGFMAFEMDNFGQTNCSAKPPVYHWTEMRTGRQIKTKQWMGATVSDIDEGIMSSTASNGLSGVFFKEVPVDCIAFSYGFRSGDILKTVKGFPISDLESLSEESCKLSDFDEATVFRHGRLQSLQNNMTDVL